MDINKLKTELLQNIILTLECPIEHIDMFFAAEIEFYICDSKNTILDDLDINSPEIIQLEKYLKQAYVSDLAIDNIEKEDGFNQFEIQTRPTKNPSLLVDSIIQIRQLLLGYDNLKITFNGKPNINDAGSAIHFHISLYALDFNLFAKHKTENGENYLMIFYWAIAGMLDFMAESVYIMCDSDTCYERFLYPRKYQKHIHHPTNCSWGFNNRTCAIRVLSSNSPGCVNIDNSRIEYRVASASSNPFLVLYAIIYAIKYGLDNQLDCPEPVFGNAFDYEYDSVQELPKSIKEARALFNKGRLKFLLKE
jgi:glutamine synthetase